MMKKLWLMFAQFVTLFVAALLVASVFKPEWLQFRAPQAPVVVTQHAAEPAGKAPAASYRAAAKKAMPAVVNIYTSKEVRAPRHPLMDDPLFRRFFGNQLPNQTQRVSSLGSGVIVSSEGYILTNHHVVAAADEIEVALADGRTAPAKIVGSDPETDLAVIRVDLKNLPSITFGNADKMEVGDVVLAIGNPFGVGQTVTMGIVSALGRSHLGINTFENFIQTDAPINPGNSGGALVDAGGNLVGINSAIFSKSGGSQGIGFAIPESLVKQVMEQIIKHGSVTRGWLGVSMRDMNPETAQAFNLPNITGTLVIGVLRNGPADRANIQPGDIITGINGKALPNSAAALAYIADLAPGAQAQVSVVRKTKESKVPVTIAKRPPLPRNGEEAP
ncbi:MAG: 2-alkenal reductase [Betaproteobacteria bacterium RBG_19FT_COMBO_58_11]|nr:MAG: 2-alkenal reductase [Betaproteobacteria bacterium RBG_19FT_COMBO_58_11]